MVDVDELSDAELRTKLLEFGFPVMPITGTTRKVMAKKLRMLLENKNKIGTDGTRRSMGRYSSEDDSDSEMKATKKKENRRLTMAAPLMQPPSASTRVKKSTRLNDTSEPELSNNSVKRETRTTTSTTSRTQKIVKSAQDEFDTGSDSESDIINNYNSLKGTSEYIKHSPLKSTLASSYSSPSKYSPPKSTETSYSSTRNVSFNANTSSSHIPTYNSPSLASEYASDRLNQIRSRLSLNQPSYESPTYSSNVSPTEETPFLSNFTKRLSALSSQKNDDYKKEIKEHDTNGSSAFVRSQLTSYRATRGRDTTYDYKINQNNILKNNFVSFAVLAGAALFFVVLAILYMGMRSDTSVIPSDYIVPHCIEDDPYMAKGVNCLSEDQVKTALELLSVLKPELQKKAIANKCFDQTIKPHMTESEIISYCVTNFAIKDLTQIKEDLQNLEILTFNNPTWDINVVQTENNNGFPTEDDVAKNMVAKDVSSGDEARHQLFGVVKKPEALSPTSDVLRIHLLRCNYQEQVILNAPYKITSIVMLKPVLPWRCRFYKTFYLAFNSVVFVILIFGVFYMLNLGYKYYRHYEQKQKDEIGFMVEKIIDILQSSCSEEEGESFVVINHVRDMILPVVDRHKKAKTWTKAVKFINENESRVRTEIQEVKGEPFEVWRWIGRANMSVSGSPRNKSWQGQAFETQVGSVNSLPCSPTPCLKIRGMVEDGDRNMHMIREAVLSKCAHQCRILHCTVETNSKCVYLKCADPSDAAIAYRNLHGWWYAGHLVTVKYLRLERYMQRFPDSPVNGPPFLKAITPATDWSN